MACDRHMLQQPVMNEIPPPHPTSPPAAAVIPVLSTKKEASHADVFPEFGVIYKLAEKLKHRVMFPK